MQRSKGKGPMGPVRWLAAGALGFAWWAAGGAARPASAEAGGHRRAPPARLLFAGPLSGPLAPSGEESLFGVRAALPLAPLDAGLAEPELLVHDDGDEVKRAEAAFDVAKSKKVDAIVAAATGATVDAYVTRARKAGLPLLLVGSAGPATFDAATPDPVVWLGTSAVEQAIVLGSFLEIPCRSRKPGFVIEATPRGRELHAAFERNLAHRFTLAAPCFVAPHAAVPSEALQALQAAGADRLVVAGEPDLVDATIAALAQAKWSVPLFLADGLQSAAARALHEADAAQRLGGLFLLDGQPRLHAEIADGLSSAWQKAHGDALVASRARRAFDATRHLVAALGGAAKKRKVEEFTAALRTLRYGADENERPLLDETQRSARHLWTPWKLGAAGPIADDPRLYYDPDFGPLLRVRPLSLYRAEPGTKVVHLWYGDAYSKAVRTIEADLAALGLITRGYDGELDRWILDELLARTMGKLNQLFLRHEDGTAIPGVSFAISFTHAQPEGLDEHEYWRAVIAGDDAEAGGRAWPGEGRCEIYSTFIMRTIFQKDALRPPLKGEDKRFLDGKYAWGTTTEENLRVKTLRCLIDGYAGAFALTGAHELGHLAGLGHDESDPRSIMNVAEGAGLRETSACWIPDHVATLERVLGRVGTKGRKKR